MNIIKQFGHQGDVQTFEIKEIPKSAKKINKQFLAKSERSGSLHGLFGDYDLYEIEKDGEIGYCVDAKGELVLNHTLESNLKGVTMDDAKVLPKKDHRHSIIPAGTKLFIGIQRRADPLTASFKRVSD